MPKARRTVTTTKTVVCTSKKRSLFGSYARISTSKKYLRVRIKISNAALYLRPVAQNLACLCACHVHDNLNDKCETYSRTDIKTEKKFQLKFRKLENLSYTKVHIDKVPNRFMIHQKKYIEKHSTITNDAGFIAFNTTLAIISWTTQTRSDV